MKQASIRWQQGQPVNEQFDDVYFSTQGGIAETEHVFLQNNGLPERWRQLPTFVIAETGFGSGLNFLTTLHHWLQTSGPDDRLSYYSVEKYPLSRADLQQALSAWPQFDAYLAELLSAYPPAVDGFHHLNLYAGRVSLVLMLGDAAAMLEQMDASVDAWYLDGFAPSKNPEMWTEALFQQIARLSHPGTRFSTFTAAGSVRRGLQAQGFEVNKVEGFGKKREMLAGVFNGQSVSYHPVSQRPPWYVLPQFKTRQKRLAVIGAGIAGVTTAYLLAQRGWQVDLIDRQAAPAMGGSGNPRGVLMPRISLDTSAEAEFYNGAYFAALRSLAAIKQQQPDFDWHQEGVIQLASSDRIEKQIRQLGCAPELAQAVTAQQASDLCGHRVACEALYYPQAGCLSPADLCGRLLSMAGKAVRFHGNTEITALQRQDDQWGLVGRLVGGSPAADAQPLYQVDAVVLANATAVAQFAQSDWIPLQAVRGQISYLPQTRLSQSIKTAICYDGYILPADKGQHVIGATFAAQDAVDVRAEDHQANLVQLQAWLPGLFDADADPLQGRAAVRAVTQDRMPVVGPVARLAFFNQQYADLQKGRLATQYPQAEYVTGLYVNAGHGARGLTSAWLSAEVLATQLNNDSPCVSNRVQIALNPSRFIVRALKKGQRFNNDKNNSRSTPLPCDQCTGCM